MKRILAVMLIGLLLIGAASAGYDHNKKGHKAPIGVAISCADAFAKGEAYVSPCVVADSCKTPLVIGTNAWAITYQIDDAKVDPIAVSMSAGGASSGIAGKLEFGHGRCADEVIVDMDASSYAQAYDYSRGSMFATAATDTFNKAETWATPCGLGSESIASSESFGMAMGVADPDAKEGAGSQMFDKINDDIFGADEEPEE